MQVSYLGMERYDDIYIIPKQGFNLHALNPVLSACHFLMKFCRSISHELNEHWKQCLELRIR
jgi:hypothetical protein